MRCGYAGWVHEGTTRSASRHPAPANSVNATSRPCRHLRGCRGPDRCRRGPLSAARCRDGTGIVFYSPDKGSAANGAPSEPGSPDHATHRGLSALPPRARIWHASQAKLQKASIASLLCGWRRCSRALAAWTWACSWCARRAPRAACRDAPARPAAPEHALCLPGHGSHAWDASARGRRPWGRRRAAGRRRGAPRAGAISHGGASLHACPCRPCRRMGP